MQSIAVDMVSGAPGRSLYRDRMSEMICTSVCVHVHVCMYNHNIITTT